MNRLRRCLLTRWAAAGSLLATGAASAGAVSTGGGQAGFGTDSAGSVARLRVQSGVQADQTAAIQATIDACSARGVTRLVWPMSAGQVYRVDGVINARQIAFVGDAGPRNVIASGYTFNESSLKSCIYLRGRNAQIVDLTYAEGLAVVCNRRLHRTHALAHSRRLQWHSQNFAIHHAGANALHMPYGCIHWYYGPASEITRARGYGVYLADQDDGSHAPDTDSNVIVCDGGRLSYNRRGNFFFAGSGGVFDFHGGFDITKAGEPDESGAPAPGAFAVTLHITKGTNSCSFSFRDGWMEKNCNLFDIAGTIKNLTMEQLRITAYDGVSGVMFRLAGYVYHLHARQIGYSGPRYRYLFDAAQLRLDPAMANNGIRIEPSVEGYLHPCDPSVAGNLRLLRAIGGFMLRTFPAGTIKGSRSTNDGSGRAYYVVERGSLASASPIRPIAARDDWYFDRDQARDISLIVGGQYAGEVRHASETGWVTDALVSPGDGSVGFYVRQKLQTESGLPRAYTQHAIQIT
jgi:hypothetical protein